jgi:hypothetical protein
MTGHGTSVIPAVGKWRKIDPDSVWPSNKTPFQNKKRGKKGKERGGEWGRGERDREEKKEKKMRGLEFQGLSNGWRRGAHAGSHWAVVEKVHVTSAP